jgi:hypothetical protein
MVDASDEKFEIVHQRSIERGAASETVDIEYGDATLGRTSCS